VTVRHIIPSTTLVEFRAPPAGRGATQIRGIDLSIAGEIRHSHQFLLNLIRSSSDATSNRRTTRRLDSKRVDLRGRSKHPSGQRIQVQTNASILQREWTSREIISAKNAKALGKRSIRSDTRLNLCSLRIFLHHAGGTCTNSPGNSRKGV